MTKYLFKILRYSGLPCLIRFFFQRNKVTILLFHDLKRDNAKTAFQYLTEKYNIISLNDYIKYRLGDNSIKLPPKSLIITFDDGHIGNYELLPVVQDLKINITIFLCAAIINTNRHYWFKLSHPEFKSTNFKSYSNQQRLEKLKKFGFEQTKEYDFPMALKKNQIEDMKPHINFQSHTLFHPIIPSCSDKEAAIEINDSKTILENEYGLEINTLSYPNGDYSQRDIILAKEAAYNCGITVDFGYNDDQTDMFRLKRLSVNDTNDLNELIVKSSGLWAFLKTRNGKKQEFGYK